MCFYGPLTPLFIDCSRHLECSSCEALCLRPFVSASQELMFSRLVPMEQKNKNKKKAQTLNKCLRSRCRTNIFKHSDEKRKHSQKTSHDFLDNRLKCPTLESYHKWKCILCVLSVFFYYNAKKISFICLSWCQKIIKLTASSTMQFFSLLWFIIQFHLKTAQQSKNT